jgi:uncharacterized membrane protein
MFFSRHWLAIFNLGFALYVVLPVLAPTLMHLGHPRLAGAIYTLYHSLCHQLPERSYFLFGRGHLVSTYSLEHLKSLGVLPGASPWQRREFVGNAVLGYKMAFCQRCFATYLSFFLAGMAFGVTGKKWKGLSLKGLGLMLLPMALDGGLQFVGLHRSNWVLRSITGALFGVGVVWFTYPRIALGIETSFRGTPPEAPPPHRRTSPPT